MTHAAEKKNQLVWEALESGDTKRALQLCSRRLKKGEKGDYIQVKIRRKKKKKKKEKKEKKERRSK
jgi:hypothetical protein